MSSRWPVCSCPDRRSLQNTQRSGDSEAQPGSDEGISCLLNILAGLRLIFENPENVYGYRGISNDNSPFSGKVPLD